jgi:hypothetical protein
MLKNRSTLEIGGMLPASRAQDLATAFSVGGGTYLRRDRTLLSLRSLTQEDLMAHLEEGAAAVFFEESQSPDISPYLEEILDDLALDYRWAWEGYYNTEPGIICVDAHKGERAQFLSIAGRVVLDSNELTDTKRCGEALLWASWSPRPLAIYTSNHELLQRTFQSG